MSAQILDGRKVRDLLTRGLVEKFANLSAKTMAIIQVGDRAESTSYIKGKKAFAEKIGVATQHIQLPEDATLEMVLEKIENCNGDPTIRGIIVQLPLPLALDRDIIINAIDPEKDVDALTSERVKGWTEGREDALWPATVRGIKTLLEFYKIDLFGKKVVIIGRSMLVGKPLAAMCISENATVTVCHSKTADLARETLDADIVISAAGKQNLIGKEQVSPGQIVIDVGINTVEGEKLDDEIADRKLVGDVDFEEVSKIVAMITPVPGGVGPMTVLGLFQNLLDLCES
ncbi:MAG: tetrahydrofolate dehydrogenase/cyclohydrolase catalytic domain-containing protein [Candidatus Paceibacterota bacterium]